MYLSCEIWLSIVVQLFVMFNVVRCDYYIMLINTSAPAVQGANVTFDAALKEENGNTPPPEQFKWEWKVNGEMITETKTNIASAEFTMNFPREKYPPRNYTIAVAAYVWRMWIPLEVAHASKKFTITSVLNGELSLWQNGIKRDTNFISSAVPLNQTVKISAADVSSLVNVTYMTTYWFIDCQYVGQSDEIFAVNHFKKENASHNIEALVVASFDPRPVPTTTTTTTTTTTSTTTTSTTTTTTTTTTPATSTSTSTTPATTTSSTTTPKSTIKPNATTTSEASSAVHTIRKRESNESNAQQQIVELLSANDELDTRNVIDGSATSAPGPSQMTAQISTYHDIQQPFVCFNKSAVAPDPKKVYGYFSKDVTVRNPLTNVTVSGATWLKHGDVMELNVKCIGSPPIEYCTKIILGAYNTTGNETCDAWFTPETCDFSFTHYFGEVQPNTVLIFMRNQVTVLTKVVTINIYDVKKQSQLSIIVVPFIFMLFAITSVIFGVAKYVQRKNRFSVEVADFDFGETSSVDLEYKTFHRRLLDSIGELMRREPMTTNEGIESTDSSQRYGTMT